MYYEVPAAKPQPGKLAQIFPWESRAIRPTRVFPQEEPIASPTPPQQSTSPSKDDFGSSEGGNTSSASEEADSWQTYSRMNAWDEVPEIQKYIQAMQRPKRAKTQVLYGGTSSTTGTTSPGTSAGGPDWTVRITDFPSEVERPSLPVTPAPIRRPSVWNQDDDAAEELPAAEGVPSQEDWVRATVDVFLHLLRATYLYCDFIESSGPPRESSAAVRSVGERRTALRAERVRLSRFALEL